MISNQGSVKFDGIAELFFSFFNFLKQNVSIADEQTLLPKQARERTPTPKCAAYFEL